jgi:hypothetical protein
LCAGLVGCAAFACLSSEQRGRKAEVRELVERLDRVVDTSGAARREALANLERASCSFDETRRFQLVCVRSYRTLDAAKADLGQLGRLIDAAKAGATLPTDVARRVSVAEAALADSRKDADACVAQRGELTQRYDSH